jgi:hypothetical protein
MASYIPAENDSPASSQSRMATSAGVARAAARSSTRLSCIMSFLSVAGVLATAAAGPAADDGGGEAGGGAEAEGVPRAGYVGQRADDR